MTRSKHFRHLNVDGKK